MINKKQQTKLVQNNLNKRPTIINANKPNTDLSMFKLTKSAATSPVNMGANRKLSGPQAPSKKTTTSIDKPKLIKKAYVRFDDYLDLNEENMRRSCKRLMNHLYSESSSTAPPMPIVAAPAISCQSTSSSLTPKTGAGLPIKSPTLTKNISNRSLPPTPLQQQQQQHQQQQQKQPATSKGKSYLRAQYERRQLRQMELMQQEQFTSEANRCMHLTGGASARRQQQDLVVAKSHELSKRRFFEKLERRELIKNSTLAGGSSSNSNNNCITHPTGEHAIKQQMGASKEPTSSYGDHRRQVNQETSNRQKNLAAINNDEIMLDVYQSIVSKNNRNDSNLNTNNDNTDSTLSSNKVDTLGRLAGTQVRDSTGELIGFYTPAPNLSSACCCCCSVAAVSAFEEQQQEERLIEFSAASTMNRCCRECSATLVAPAAAAADQSAFEIKVPAASSSLLDRDDGFISSGLLVVKQVEVAAELDGVYEVKGDQSLDLIAEQQAKSVALCGRHKEQTSSTTNTQSIEAATTRTEMAALDNKTKMPLVVDEFGSKNNSKVNNAMLPGQCSARRANDCNGSGNLSETMTENSDDQEELPQPLTPSIASSDNQQQVAGVGSAISSGSNNNSNKMKKISSLEANGGDEQDQTTSQLDGLTETTLLLSSSSKALKKEEEKEEEGKKADGEQVNRRRPVCIEVSGASNCLKNHEAPEMAMLPIGQSGGAKESPLAGAGTLDLVNLVYPVQTQSAAQVQQVASLQTTITKLAIRDVPPEASGIKSIEALVSEERTNHYNTTTSAACGDAEKVIVTAKQVNEEQHEGLSDTDGYANPVATLAKEDTSEFSVENNLNHDVVKVNSTVEREKILSSGAHIDLMGEDKHLIEPLRIVVQNSKQEQKSSVSNSHLPNEEDGGSSCGSSGFGASVSVTSSLDGSNSMNDTVVPNGSLKRQQVGEQYRRPTSLALALRKASDSVSSQRRNSLRSRPAEDYPGYKELVGPDQAYPSKGLAMLIENDSYASVLNRTSDGSASGLDASIVLENDEDLLEGYANLPRSMASPVGYATVCAPTSEQQQQVNNKRYLENSPSEASSSSSGHSYSTSSANSGGFSALPPAQVEPDCSSSNNFESLVSLSGENSQKKTSLLKRFGSLVSKAFIGAAANTQSATPKINETPPDDCCKHQQQPEYNANNGAKSALVIEGDHQVVAVVATGQEQVNEADLVILPTKSSSSINQHQSRKLNAPQNQHQPFEHNSTAVRRSLHDDRLSRAKRHSRKLKQQQVDSSSTTFTSSTYSSSESSLNVRRFGSQRRQFKLKRADSLSEELESLMSRSTDQKSDNQRKSKDFKNQKRALSSGRNEPLSLTSGRIDIDCVSPTSKIREDKLRAVLGDHGSSDSKDKSTGPRSLIRLFYPTTSSQHALDSVDSSKPHHYSRQSSQCKISTTEAMKEHLDKVQQPISGFWGFSSLIGYSHATTNDLDGNILPVTKTGRKATTRSKAKKNSGNTDDEDQDSLVYSNLRPLATGYRIQPTPRKQQAQDPLHYFDKHQSLCLMHQDLLPKRNHRHGGHHRHHHHHHHHHHNKHQSASAASRHAHYLAPSSAKCTQSCGQNGYASSSSASSTFCCEQGKIKGKPVVWGQLIKINKSDGSQVIELQRSPGKSWGFFVARGAINNVKGIFISRMHDNATSNSLTGLLSIGDRILAINEHTIEPDYDILRVNQMISEKSKILLKVKPFKG